MSLKRAPHLVANVCSLSLKGTRVLGTKSETQRRVLELSRKRHLTETRPSQPPTLLGAMSHREAPRWSLACGIKLSEPGSWGASKEASQGNASSQAGEPANGKCARGSEQCWRAREGFRVEEYGTTALWRRHRCTWSVGSARPNDQVVLLFGFL